MFLTEMTAVYTKSVVYHSYYYEYNKASNNFNS